MIPTVVPGLPFLVLTTVTSLRSLGHTEEAVRHARAARKKRIICFFLFLLICGVIAIVIAVPIVKAK